MSNGNTAKKVRLFRFTVGRRSAKVERFENRSAREARKRVSEMPIEDLLKGVLSEVLLDTMIDRGFTSVGDVWPDSRNVRKLVPSYGRVKDRKVQNLIEDCFNLERAK